MFPLTFCLTISLSISFLITLDLNQISITRCIT